MSKYSAYGTKIKRGGTEIAQVKTISGLALTVDMEDVTTHDSVEAFEEVITTIIRSGEVSLEIVYDPSLATHKNAAGGLLHDLLSRAKVGFTIDLPTDPVKSWVFDAFVTNFDPEFNVDGSITAGVTLKPTGKVTIP